MISMFNLYLLVPLAPLAGALIAGLFGKTIGRTASHTVAVLGVLIAFLASCLIYLDVAEGNAFNGSVYTWASSGGVDLEIGFQIDSLTVLMMLVVTFVSLMVHVYTIGYMVDDQGYQRFFSYISLFTFSMLMLVMSNNFLQLFFGWEAVGLVSYLLIGFWYTRPTAVYANLKAFLVNRVGDFGFLLGIGLIVAYTGSLNYAEVFSRAQNLAVTEMAVTGWPLITAICLCLFVGAMGKSAQVPLHVWLPDSMEGPTPISALIHAATMVTAGIFMVSRMSPLFELSEAALSFILVIGATTALFMGFLGIIQNDIKRVVAYSTLSQLGYMTVALGASAYSAALFHLMTHAFFKALLFLGAGSVIMGMHHDQDIRNMGGLWKHMPITWLTSLVGSLALIGFPLFSGFYSKDLIIEAVGLSTIPGARYAYYCVLLGVFVTAFYSFRMYFLVFHGNERFDRTPGAAEEASGVHQNERNDEGGGEDDHDLSHHGFTPGEKPHESPWVVTTPLVLLAIPSVMIGFHTVEPLLFGDWFRGVLYVAEKHDTVGMLSHDFHGAVAMAGHGVRGLPFSLAIAGVVTAWLFYVWKPALPQAIRCRYERLYLILENKYYFDRINEILFASGSRAVGRFLWRMGDQGIIDGAFVNGSARLVGSISRLSRYLQTGAVYQYAFSIILGVILLLSLWGGGARSLLNVFL